LILVCASGRAERLRLQRAELFELALLHLDHRLRDLVQERMDGLRRPGHAALHRELGEALVAVQPAQLAAQLRHFVEDLEVAGGAALRVGDVVALARFLVLRGAHERDEVRVVEPDHDVPLSVPDAVNVRLRQPFVLGRREGELGGVVADVRVELLRQDGDAVGDLLRPRPLLFRQRDAAVFE
jgi:hypothetical protein